MNGEIIKSLFGISDEITEPLTELSKELFRKIELMAGHISF